MLHQYRPHLLSPLFVMAGLLTATLSGAPVEIQFPAKYRPVPQATQLKLAVRNLNQATSDLIVGIEPIAGTRQVACLSGAIPKVPRVTATFADQSSLLRNDEPGVMTIDAAALAGQRLAFHIQVPIGTPVQLEVNGKTLLALTVHGGGLFHNGKLLTDRAPLFAVKAFASTYDEIAFQPQVAAKRLGNGEFFVYPEGIRSHLLQSPGLPRPICAAGTGCATGQMVHAQIWIDNGGTVTDVKLLNASPALTSDIAPKLKAMRFRPFEENGRQVSATGIILVNIAANGDSNLLL